MCIRKVLGVLAALVAIVFAGGATAQTLEKIKQRGTIVVGVKTDYKPWGFLDPSGKTVGLEVDMADEIAKKLGVKLELVPVQTANRIEFLQQGRIDLMIATMSENPQRRQVVGVIDPGYFAGGGNILTRKAARITKWEDLKDRPVCGIQGAYYNRPAVEKYGVNLLAFAGIPEAQNALLSGTCVAFLQDSTLQEAVLLSGDAKWQDFEMPLVTENIVSWHVAVPLAEKDGPYGRFISELLAEWHKSGKLIELNKKWGLKPNPFLEDMHQKAKAKS